MTDFAALTHEFTLRSTDVVYRVSNLANAAALLFQYLEDVNWAGFYLMVDGRLELGPFQGKAARVEIELGEGVCGTAALRGETVPVPNVHEFPGHIACDCASNAEIVIPLYVSGALFGVLDIDSPKIGRFTGEEQAGLESFARLLEQVLENGK